MRPVGVFGEGGVLADMRAVMQKSGGRCRKAGGDAEKRVLFKKSIHRKFLLVQNPSSAENPPLLVSIQKK